MNNNKFNYNNFLSTYNQFIEILSEKGKEYCQKQLKKKGKKKESSEDYNYFLKILDYGYFEEDIHIFLDNTYICLTGIEEIYKGCSDYEINKYSIEIPIEELFSNNNKIEVIKTDREQLSKTQPGEKNGNV